MNFLNRDSRKHLGVAVMEIVVALTILTIILAPTFHAFVSTTRAVKLTGDSTIAVYICQKLIEDIRFNKYNEDTSDFSKFLRDAAENGKTFSGDQCSRYFGNVFDSDCKDDLDFLNEIEKFTINISYDNYSVPPDATEKQIEDNSTIDVDGDGVKDPDASQVTITVSWVKTEDKVEKEFQTKFSTILARRQVHK